MIIERLSNFKAHPQVSKGDPLAIGECTCPTKPLCQAAAWKTLNVGKDSDYYCCRFDCPRCVNHRKSCRATFKKAMSKSTEEFSTRAVRTSCKEVSTCSMSENKPMRSTSQVHWCHPRSGLWHCRRYPNHLQESQFQIEAGLVDGRPWSLEELLNMIQGMTTRHNHEWRRCNGK